MVVSTKGRPRSTLARRETVEHQWYVVDASAWPLGRLASRLAVVLMGKHKPIYTPFVDTGDFVIVLNARQVRISGKKRELKIYQHWTDRLGGLRKRTFAEEQARRPDQIIELAVRRMLPKNRLARAMLSKLKIYADGTHPHAAQQPKPFPWAPPER